MLFASNKDLCIKSVRRRPFCTTMYLQWMQICLRFHNFFNWHHSLYSKDMATGINIKFVCNIISDHLMLLNRKTCGWNDIFFRNYNSRTVWVDSVFQLLGHCFRWIALPCASKSYLRQPFVSQQHSAAGDSIPIQDREKQSERYLSTVTRGQAPRRRAPTNPSSRVHFIE